MSSLQISYRKAGVILKESEGLEDVARRIVKKRKDDRRKLNEQRRAERKPDIPEYEGTVETIMLNAPLVAFQFLIEAARHGRCRIRGYLGADSTRTTMTPEECADYGIDVLGDGDACARPQNFLGEDAKQKTYSKLRFFDSEIRALQQEFQDWLLAGAFETGRGFGSPNTSRQIADWERRQKINQVLKVARELYPIPAKRPAFREMACEVARDHRCPFKEEAVRQILSGRYRPMVSLGMKGLET